METEVLNAFLGHPICQMMLSDLTTADFAEYRDERLQDIKPNSLKRQLNPIQNMFNVAKKDWGIPIPVNPVSALGFKVRDDRRERRVATTNGMLSCEQWQLRRPAAMSQYGASFDPDQPRRAPFPVTDLVFLKGPKRLS